MRGFRGVLVLGFLAAAGCGAGGAAATNGKPRVVCTTGMVADLVRGVVGDRADVVQLLGAGVDPHRYTITPGDERQLRQADFVVFSGLRLEGKMADALDGRRGKQPIAAVADFIDQTRTMKEHDQAHDPHVWFDVTLWGGAAPGLADALAKWRPADAEYFRANAAGYVAALTALDAEVRQRLSGVPPARRVLVTSHDAFRYFGKAYGWEVRGVQGISTEDEADLRQLNELVAFLVRRKIPAVFVESTVPPRNLQAVIDGCKAQGHAVAIGGELYSDALGEPGSGAETYPGMIRANAGKLAEALR
jgi:manganese/zinc/iron transport system substrate-binding protein